jgi:cbb3-type cytochrome oxidase maturation protein
MSVLYVLVPVALIVVFAAVCAYAWAAQHGQFDDLDTPALRAIQEDPSSPRPDARTSRDDRAR